MRRVVALTLPDELKPLRTNGHRHARHAGHRRARRVKEVVAQSTERLDSAVIVNGHVVTPLPA